MKIGKLFLVAGLVAGLSSVAVAGPGPQYWQNQTKAAAARQAAKTDKVAPSDKTAGSVKDAASDKCVCSSKCACSPDTKCKA